MSLLTWPGWSIIIALEVAIGLIACVWFVVAFQRRSNGAWRNNPFGRFLMYRKALLGTMFLLILSGRLWPDFPGRLMLWSVLLGIFVFQTFVPYRLLMRTQEKVIRQDEVNEREASDHDGSR